MSERIEVETDAGAMPAQLWLPEGGRGPGILLLQEIFGVSAYIRRRAADLAGLGYVVLAPELFWRAGVTEVANGPDMLDEAMAVTGRTDWDTAVADAVTALRALRERPEVSSGVGVVGFCYGGGLGYAVVAATGRPEEGDYLKALGAATVIERKELTEAPDRPLLSERYAGVVDTVSGVMLARALAQVKYGGAAAVCGLAGGPAFPGSILPFILRGVAMYGIDSVMMPKGPREEAWRRLGSDLPLDRLDSTVSEAGLGDLLALAPKILKGAVRGRVVVDVSK